MTLQTVGGATLSNASTFGTVSPPTDAFYATAVLSGSGSSGATLCTPFGSTHPYVGYDASAAQSIWYATASTGSVTDTVTLTDGIQVNVLQPAGDYTGIINYSVIPKYFGTATC